MQIKYLQNTYYATKRINDKSSSVALGRLKKIELYEKLRREGVPAGLALEAIQTPRATLRRWQKLYRERGVAGLENRSRRPHQVRPRQWTRKLRRLVLRLRRDNPTWGKDKIHKVLERDAKVKTSASTVGRILHQAMHQEKRIRPAAFYTRGRVKPKKPRPFKGHAQRWKAGTKAKKPGEMVQLDTMTVHFPGFTVKHFNAVCPITGLVIARAGTRATAASAERFLDYLCRKAPFPIVSLQVDGGSEFMGKFEEACRDRGIALHVLPPRSPKLNGCVERANGTFRGDFYNTYTGMLSIEAVNQELAAFVEHYNHYRPHAGIDLQTPMAYYEQLMQAA